MRGKTYAGRLRLRYLPEGRSQADIEDFVTGSIEPGSTIATDGWQGYDSLRR